MTKPLEIRRTAYHEAGHAVATAALGFDVAEVSIIPDGTRGTCGHQVNVYNDDTQWRTWTDPDGKLVQGFRVVPSAYKAHAVALYAGRAAEALLDGERDAQQAFMGVLGDRDDRRHAVERIGTIWVGFGERRKRVRRYRRLALWLVWRHRANVERVAEALLRFHRLDDAEFDIAQEQGPDGVRRFRAEWGRS